MKKNILKTWLKRVVNNLEHFGERIQPGTVICFDEYINYLGWKEGEYRAFSEFLKRTGFGVEYLAYNNRGTQVALRIVG